MTPQPQPPSVTHSQNLIFIMSDLGTVMEDEVTLLEKREYAQHAQLLRRKQELTMNYQSSLKAFAEGTPKGSLNPQDHGTLVNAGKKLEAITAKNAEALRMAEASSNRLLQNMMEEVRKEVQKESSYSRQAVLSAAEKGVMRPVAINRRV